MGRYGLTGIVDMDVTELDPHTLFIKLFRETLKFQLQEDVFSRVGEVWSGRGVGGMEWKSTG